METITSIESLVGKEHQKQCHNNKNLLFRQLRLKLMLKLRMIGFLMSMLETYTTLLSLWITRPSSPKFSE